MSKKNTFTGIDVYDQLKFILFYHKFIINAIRILENNY